jgi:type I restriction enzyme, S subunit
MISESRTLAALRDTLLPKLISDELLVKRAEKLLAKVE